MTRKQDTLPTAAFVEFLTNAKKLKISAKALAKKSGFSEGTLSSWKRGKTSPTLLDFNMLEAAKQEIEEELKNNNLT